jgi:hypothetical protein
MFIWDFVASAVFDQLLDWVHATLVDLFSDFFTMMNGMGVEIFEFTWVQALLLFFEKIAWALYAVGLVLAMFETAIAYQNGRGSIQNTALNLIKGFFAASLVTKLPVEAYKFAITLQGYLTQGLSGLTEGLGTISISNLSYIKTLSLSAIFMIFLVIALGYAVIKVFFANLKRGGILLIQIAVGTLYMISIPRGFTDAFTGWCKHVIGLCLTAFLQTVVLTAGLLVFKENLLLGVGLMLSASEIPRITEQFGMDTSLHGNVTSALYAGQAAFSLTHSILRTIK